MIKKFIKSVVRNAKTNFGVLIISAVVVIIAYSNYSHGTFLTGWDTLHPEFNYKIYWPRMINSVWQGHQGLGAVATQAHASEIPRVITIMLFDIFLPTKMIRYAYAFFMLLMGPLGVYFFFKLGIFNKNDVKHSNDNISGLHLESASTVAGLFYLLNLVTVQHFYVPLEMFLTHYGYLGFFMLSVVYVLRSASKKNLAIFMLVSFFMAPQAHTSTLFVALVINLACFFAPHWIISRFNIEYFKKYLLILFLLFSVNAFWLLPNAYFIAKHGFEVQQSKIHSLFNEEATLQNREFGKIEDIVIGKGFLFNWGEHVGNLRYGDLLNEWKSYDKKPGVLVTGYSLFIVVFLGFVASLFSKRKELISVSAFLLISAFFLFNENPPTGFIFSFLEQHLPLFREAFRFHFTKFSITLVFSYAVFFGYTAYLVIGGVNKVLSRTKLADRFKTSLADLIPALVLVSCLFTLSFWMFPIYKGGLISPSMRVDIPKAYFDMFDYLNAQPEFGRVADLPIHSFWGWVYYNWDPETRLGYQGAGFLWFGIKQPLLDREFDRWNIINQHYYNDMVDAVYSEDINSVIAVLEKYKIRWIIHDTSIEIPAVDQRVLFHTQTKVLLESSSSIKLVKRFNSDLYLYEYIPEADFKILEEVSSDQVQAVVGPGVYDFSTDYTERIKDDFIRVEGSELVIGNESQQGGLDSLVNIKAPFNVFVSRVSNNLILLLKSSIKSSPAISDTRQIIPLTPEIVGSDVSLLMVGDNYYVLNISSEFPERFLGTVYLPLDKKYGVKIYKEKVAKVELANLAYELENCSDAGYNSEYSVEQARNGFILKGKNIDACLTTGLDLLPVFGTLPVNTDDTVLRMEAYGEFKDPPCIYNDKYGVCQNYMVNKNESFTSLTGSLINYYLRFYSRGLTNGYEESTYENLSVDVFTGAQFSSEYDLSNSTGLDFLNAVFQGPLRFSIGEFDGGNVSGLFSNPRVCQTGVPLNVYNVSSQVMVYETSDKEICDSFRFYNTRHNLGYILKIQSKYISGIPLRICLTNEYSKRCDKYIQLPKNPEMADSYYFVPSLDSYFGYTVNVSGYSFAGEISKNELKSVQLIPIPYDFIMKLRSTQQISTSRVVVYNQAYEDSWLAFCGYRLCDAKHIFANGWANGWVFENSYRGKVTIMFWPQLFQYFGFSVLAATTLWLCRRKK